MSSTEKPKAKRRKTSGKEFTKTLAFVAVAVLTLFIAVKTQPVIESEEQLTGEDVGKPLFEKLTDPSMVTGLEVLSFDEELGSLKPFEIEQEREGEWVIPSKQRYPADAQDRVARAATMFIDLKVNRVVSEQDANHKTFGVVEPKYGTTKIGDEGIGTLFKVKGNSGDANEQLAELIIGKQVKDLAGQYYVRRPGKSRVYQVEIDPSQLSTKFVDWIDTSLLPFTPQDIASVIFRNYTTEVNATDNGNSLKLSVNYESEVSLDSAGQWKIDDLREFRGGELKPTAPAMGEIPNQQKLNLLLAAIDQLSINDVRKKAGAASGQLGFYSYQSTEDQPPQLFATQGELLVNTVQGVQFRVLIGSLAEQDTNDLSAGTELNRYLHIVPQLYDAAFPMPELEELPSENEERSENDRKLAVERITKANKRKTDERDKLIAAAQKRVTALNTRLEGWYFQIPENTVRKLRIPRNELLILSQEALSKGFGIEAFRMLQESFPRIEPKPEN